MWGLAVIPDGVRNQRYWTTCCPWDGDETAIVADLGTVEVANEGLHLEVDGDASLVAVNGEEQDALPVHHLVILPTPAALRRTAERLDADNIGAEVGEGLDPHAPEQEMS